MYTRGMIARLNEKFGTDKFFTSSEVNLHAATLNALCNRGYLVKKGKQYCVAAKGLIFNRIEELYADRSWISLRRAGEPLGMHCRIKGADVLDAWDKPYDVAAVVEYSFDKNWHFLNEKTVDKAENM